MRDIPTKDLVLKLMSLKGYAVKPYRLDATSTAFSIAGGKVRHEDVEADKFIKLDNGVMIYVVSKGILVMRAVVIDGNFDHFSWPRENLEPSKTTASLNDELAIAREIKRRMDLYEDKTKY